MGGESTKHPLIQFDPKIMVGKPVVKGTRVTVELILEKLGAGETVEQILDEHPRLTREGVLAALSFGAEIAESEDVLDKLADEAIAEKRKGKTIPLDLDRL